MNSIHFYSCFTHKVSSFYQSLRYFKREDFDFEIVNLPFLDGDVPCSTSYGVYISQLI